MSDVDFVVNDDGTPCQDNSTGIDIEGNALGHSDDDISSDSSWDDSDNDFGSSDDW